ncbi:unnamed protein product [Vitrella brassicaformis CCMP3155]|uniref:Uncharacterized protein n=2 Tax=Vitrella brassicaformis TaxID=1169539 RepID=A0A0G4F622_VITBC|nr:unnamed protein product [Vitrella brassicaformis CCMP3155]|mmetsp:Transcript_29356/g.73107  ORF Transcript_29356/g.73107 Transcript_29356/m.73107 type:complete len:216 (+) Transcript_29356:200-847(+)|eukprot:CEM07543.1 unnamed protein product [Vitrella brassicaformis CCMP3155]
MQHIPSDVAKMAMGAGVAALIYSMTREKSTRLTSDHIAIVRQFDVSKREDESLYATLGTRLLLWNLFNMGQKGFYSSRVYRSGGGKEEGDLKVLLVDRWDSVESYHAAQSSLDAIVRSQPTITPASPPLSLAPPLDANTSFDNVLSIPPPSPIPAPPKQQQQQKESPISFSRLPSDARDMLLEMVTHPYSMLFHQRTERQPMWRLLRFALFPTIR